MPLRLPGSDQRYGTRGFAAAPEERWSAPRIVSSLYPHLPRAHMEAFRAALAVGATTIIVLAVLQFFPLALVASAVIVPLLTIVYLWEVDLYEDAPLPVLVLTIVWGAAAGAASGLVARAIARENATFIAGPTSRVVLLIGIALPVAATCLMLLGPVLLLPYRKFNDVLDGTTFGAASAVTFVGAQTLTNSADLFHSGVTAVGSTGPWVVRLLTLGLARPLLVAGAIGAAAGTLWLRYRAPVRNHHVLGVLGSPAVAIPIALVVIVAASLIQIYADRWLALAGVTALALVTLIALRRVIHIGLLQEAGELEIGDPLYCPSCGRETPQHAFCAHCGVCLIALPKAPRKKAEVAKA